MKRITKVVKKDNFVPEQGYLVFTEKGLIVFNGKLGILYHPRKVGERLMSVVQRYGRFAIPDAGAFMRTLAVLEDVASVDLDKDSSCLRIKFNKGRGSLDVPVVTQLHDKIPHLELKWKDYEGDKASGIPVSAVWREVTDLITNEGEALWGDVIGVYGRGSKLLSFDYGVYLAGPDVTGPDFFCPLSMLDLGINDIEYAVAEDGSIFLVGSEIQYVCVAISQSSVVTDMAKLRDDFAKGQQFNATLDLASGVWKRAKVLANEVLNMTVKDGTIIISSGSWSESLGKTGAPNASFNTRISLLERWASGSLDHKISVSSDGSWYLNGTTRSGLDFFAVLTDLNNPFKGSKAKEDVAPQKSEEVDIADTGTLM